MPHTGKNKNRSESDDKVEKLLDHFRKVLTEGTKCEEGSDHESSYEGGEEIKEVPCAFVNLVGRFKGHGACPRTTRKGSALCELHEVISRHLRLEDFPACSSDKPDRRVRWKAFFEQVW